MLFLSCAPFPKSELQCGVSLCDWGCGIAGNHTPVQTAYGTVQGELSPHFRAVYPKLATVPSFTGYWLVPPDSFWELTLQWGCVGGVHEAKANVRMEQLWLTVGVCSRGFIWCFKVVLLLQGSLVGTKETCTVERAVFPSLPSWSTLSEKFRKGVWTEVSCVQSYGFQRG